MTKNVNVQRINDIYISQFLIIQNLKIYHDNEKCFILIYNNHINADSVKYFALNWI